MRELIGRRSDHQPDDVVQVVMVSLKIPGERIEQLRVNRLRRPGRVELDVREERRLAPQVSALAGAQPEINFVQVPGAVMAGDALNVDTEEEFSGADGQLVVSIFVVDGALVGLVYVEANQEIGRRANV